MKNFENIELLQTRSDNGGGAAQPGVTPPVSGDANTTAREGAIRDRIGDTATVRNRQAADTQEIARAIANGDVQTATQLIMQMIAVQATATDQNFRAQLSLETVQGNMGNMLRIFGTIVKALGAEEFGQGMINLANDPNLTFNPVSPDMRALEAMEGDTNLPANLRDVVRNVITSMGDQARGDASLTPYDANGQSGRAGRVLADPSATPTSGPVAGAPAAAPPPAAAREPITVARAISAAAGLNSTEIASINPAFQRADANHNGTLEQGEFSAFRTALSPAVRTKLEPMFAAPAPAGP